MVKLVYLQAPVVVLLFVNISIGQSQKLTNQNIPAKSISNSKKLVISATRADIPEGVLIGSVQDLPQTQERRFLLWWNLPGVSYHIDSLGNQKDGIFWVRRHTTTKKGTKIETFARTPLPAQELQKKDPTTQIQNGVDLNGEYIVRRVGNKYVVMAYTETTELKKLFSTLDKLLVLRALPAQFNQQPQPIGLTDLELSENLMFVAKVKCFWKE